MSELKPCPFCGGEANTRIFDKVLNVGCPHCDIRTRFMLHDELDAAIEAWNTRHVETCTIGDYKDPDYGYTHDAMWNDEWFMPSGRCSGCGEYIPVWNYCPFCGRKVER